MNITPPLNRTERRGVLIMCLALVGALLLVSAEIEAAAEGSQRQWNAQRRNAK